MKEKFLILTTIFCLIFLYHNPAFSATNSAQIDQADVILLGGSYEGGKAQIGLNFKLKKGWHIYWRAAGDTGFPPTLDWATSTNIASNQISWPAPKRLKQQIQADNFMESYIYENEVTLPIAVTATEPSKPLDINLNASFAICAELCIPGNVDLSLKLEPGFKSAENMEIIASAQKLVPQENEGKDKPVIVSSESIEMNKDAPTSAAKSPASEHPAGMGIMVTMLAFAFIGGLILNVMPCVLPILSIKLLGIIKHGGGNKHEVKSSFLLTAAGIITSFLAFALITIWLKEAGEIVGWGLHFQQPYFIIALVVILTLFAANLWGLYEININLNLPQQTGGAIGHFMSGLLATVLATPCTAPFLGAAIGFAVTQGAFEIIVIFLAMGLGLAFPYLLFSVVPGLVTKLPKPGKWMIIIKKIMGSLLAVSAIWLIWVLSNQLGHMAAAILLILCIAKLIKLWACRHVEAIRKIRVPLLLLIIFLSFTIPVKISNYGEQKAAHEDMWEDFKPEQIAPLVANGKIVFVDVTADWCLTCKVNKLTVLNRAEIQAEFSRLNVVAMQADWTNRDPEIPKYLMKNKRAGIPFNIVYGPAAPDGIILSELLSKKEVLEALQKAEKK